MRKYIVVLLCAGGIGGQYFTAEAQTTLSGDHIVNGDLLVGTSNNPSNLTVIGEIGSLALPGLKVTGDGGVLFTGTLGQGKIPATDANARFMWYPGKGALRAGAWTSSSNPYWDDSEDEIGIGSVALGEASAPGMNAFAVGKNSLAWLENSTAIASSEAWETNSVAICNSFTFAPNSVALVNSAASQEFAVAMSSGYATAISSSAMSGGWAAGDYSVALAKGYTGGYCSVAIGECNADGYMQFVIGRRNSPNSNQSYNEWRDQDELFVIGNGTGKSSDPPEVQNRNALVVYKSGDVKIPKRQGDVLMGEFGNPE